MRIPYLTGGVGGEVKMLCLKPLVLSLVLEKSMFCSVLVSIMIDFGALLLLEY